MLIYELLSTSIIVQVNSYCILYPLVYFYILVFAEVKIMTRIIHIFVILLKKENFFRENSLEKYQLSWLASRKRWTNIILTLIKYYIGIFG